MNRTKIQLMWKQKETERHLWIFVRKEADGKITGNIDMTSKIIFFFIFGNITDNFNCVVKFYL